MKKIKLVLRIMLWALFESLLLFCAIFPFLFIAVYLSAEIENEYKTYMMSLYMQNINYLHNLGLDSVRTGIKIINASYTGGLFTFIYISVRLSYMSRHKWRQFKYETTMPQLPFRKDSQK